MRAESEQTGTSELKPDWHTQSFLHPAALRSLPVCSPDRGRPGPAMAASRRREATELIGLNTPSVG